MKTKPGFQSKQSVLAAAALMGAVPLAGAASNAAAAEAEPSADPSTQVQEQGVESASEQSKPVPGQSYFDATPVVNIVDNVAHMSVSQDPAAAQQEAERKPEAQKPREKRQAKRAKRKAERKSNRRRNLVKQAVSTFLRSW